MSKRLCWNRSICSYESNEYLKNYVSLKSHIDDSVFFCGELIDSVAKWYDGVPGTVSINYNDEKPTYAGGKLSKIKRIIIF